MARKKKPEEHENHERWLVSYADFITLLFAFFVVMYSVSSVNEGKYRVLSQSMMAAFRTSTKSLSPIQVGPLSRSPRSPGADFMITPKPVEIRTASIDMEIYPENPDQAFEGVGDWAMDQAEAQLAVIAADVEEALGMLIDEDLVRVRHNRLLLEVEINESVLFLPGSVIPSPRAREIIERLGQLLARFPNTIHVEGHTDNQPIRSTVFPSNWELSSARSASVVRLLQEKGVQPDRLAAIGYGQHRPITANITVEGRAHNRRVVLVVLGDLRDRKDLDFHELKLFKSQAEKDPLVFELEPLSFQLEPLTGSR